MACRPDSGAGTIAPAVSRRSSDSNAQSPAAKGVSPQLRCARPAPPDQGQRAPLASQRLAREMERGKHLAAPGVDQRQQRRAGRRAAPPQACRERLQRGDGMQGTPSPCARPRAVATPIRSPVNVPAPLRPRSRSRRPSSCRPPRAARRAPAAARPSARAAPSSRSGPGGGVRTGSPGAGSRTRSSRPSRCRTRSASSAQEARMASTRRAARRPRSAAGRRPRGEAELEHDPLGLHLGDAAPGHSTKATRSGREVVGEQRRVLARRGLRAGRGRRAPPARGPRTAARS